MPGSKSHYLERKQLDHGLGGPDYTRPATVYMSLYSAAPSDAGGGTEFSGNGYARVAKTNNDTNFPAAATVGSTTSKEIGTTVTFPQATGNQGTAVAMGVHDAEEGGNLLYWSTIPPRSIFAGDIASFPPGSVTFQEK